MDVHSPQVRSFNMSRIRGKNTKPELVVRRLVHSMGFRFRLHRRDLPGVPDLVFPSPRKIIFVHGCFWHRHACPAGQVLPKSRAEFWEEKFKGNVARDRRALASLRRGGWRVMNVWECELKNLSKLERRLRRFLGEKDS